MTAPRHHLRPATPADAELLCQMTRELARYEHLEPLVSATPERLGDILSARPARAFYDIAEVDGQPAGFSASFYSYSTFEGRHGLFVEDVYVREPWRRRGVARGLFTRLARRCVREGLSRLEWRVLAWNEPALAFFKSLPAPVNDEWRFGRMTIPEISGLVSASGPLPATA